MPAHSTTPGAPQPFAPLRAIALFALVYVLAWSLLPPLLSSSMPLDVAESLSWGHEWQWGYYKHPPLAPVLLELAYRAFGHAGPFLLSQLFIGATLWIVWRTGCRLMSRERAFIGTLLTMGVAYYTRPALEFNHNIAQMPFWAAVGYGFTAALQKDGRLRHWALVGVAGGLGLITKYSVGALLATLAIYLLATPARRQMLRPGPWLALALMGLIFWPHLRWLQLTDWMPMAYASSRAATDGEVSRADGLNFLLVQALNHVPLALIVLAAALCTRGRRRALAAADPQGVRWRLHTPMPAYLLALSVGPALLVAGLGLAMGLRVRDMWGVPMWVFSGLLVAAWLPSAGLRAMQAYLLRGLAVWLLIVSLVTFAFLAYGAQWRHRPSRMDWPQAAMAQQAAATWQAQSRCAIDSVSGDYWLVGLLAAQLPERPSVFIAGDERYSPWITPQRLAAHGTLWVGLGSDVPPPRVERLGADAGMRVQQGVWTVDWPDKRAGPPMDLHWRAYVPAACARLP